MTQAERRIFLIRELLREEPRYAGIAIPAEERAQRRLLRSLMNTRMPGPVSGEFLEAQDAYLSEEIRRKGIVEFSDLNPVQEGIYLWRGDITTLRCDAIVNAGNSQLLGCFWPCHGCIDNAIHTFSGVQLRMACADIMIRQGHEEETGSAKITLAYNLPSKYIMHTVGPVVRGWPTKRDRELLAACYRSCMELAEKNDVKSIAFCCISTGEFHFPNDMAAEIAVGTVREYRRQNRSKTEVIFDVFRDEDYKIYRKLLGAD